jgi:hypothetical protein
MPREQDPNASTVCIPGREATVEPQDGTSPIIGRYVILATMIYAAAFLGLFTGIAIVEGEFQVGRGRRTSIVSRQANPWLFWGAMMFDVVVIAIALTAAVRHGMQIRKLNRPLKLPPPTAPRE